jgi:hypothetical protein
MITDYEGDIFAVPTVVFALGTGYLVHYMFWYGKKFNTSHEIPSKWMISIK